MAKKWCGFSVQNEVIKHKWDQLAKMQDDPPEPISLESYDVEEPEEGEPVSIPIATEEG